MLRMQSGMLTTHNTKPRTQAKIQSDTRDPHHYPRHTDQKAEESCKMCFTIKTCSCTHPQAHLTHPSRLHREWNSSWSSTKSSPYMSPCIPLPPLPPSLAFLFDVSNCFRLLQEWREREGGRGRESEHLSWTPAYTQTQACTCTRAHKRVHSVSSCLRLLQMYEHRHKRKHRHAHASTRA